MREMSGASRCPHCGEDVQLDGGLVEVTEEGAEQELSCLTCGAVWHEIHRRVGFFILHAPEEE
jgi:hypothetical protein